MGSTALRSNSLILQPTEGAGVSARNDSGLNASDVRQDFPLEELIGTIRQPQLEAESNHRTEIFSPLLCISSLGGRFRRSAALNEF